MFFFSLCSVLFISPQLSGITSPIFTPTVLDSVIYSSSLPSPSLSFSCHHISLRSPYSLTPRPPMLGHTFCLPPTSTCQLALYLFSAYPFASSLVLLPLLLLHAASNHPSISPVIRCHHIFPHPSHPCFPSPFFQLNLSSSRK